MPAAIAAESWDDDFIFSPPSTASSSRRPPSKDTLSPARSRRSRDSTPKSEDDWDSPKSTNKATPPLPVAGRMGMQEELDGKGGFGRRLSSNSSNGSVWGAEVSDETLEKGVAKLLKSRVDGLNRAYGELASALPIDTQINTPKKTHLKEHSRTDTLQIQHTTPTYKAINETRHLRKKSFPIPFSSPPITPRSSSIALPKVKTMELSSALPPRPPPTSPYPASLSSGRASKNEAFLSRMSSRLSKRFSTSSTGGVTGPKGNTDTGTRPTPQIHPRHGISASVGGGPIPNTQTPHQMRRITSHVRPQHSHPEEDPESSTSRQVSLSSATTNDSSDAIRTPSPYMNRNVTAYAESRMSSTSENGNGLYRLATSPSLTSMKFHLPSPSPGSPYASSSIHAFQWGKEHQEGTEEEVPRRRTQVSPSRRHVAQERETRISQDSAVRSSISSNSDDTMELGTALKTWTFGASGTNASSDGRGLTPSRERSRRSSIQSGTRRSTDMSRQPLGEAQQTTGLNSTIKRLSSLSRKHGRKVSDGWKLVSGAKGKTSTASSRPASASVEGGINQVDPSTPRARRSVQYLPSVAGTPSPHPSVEGSGRLAVPLPVRSSSHNGTPGSAIVRDNEVKGDSPQSFRRSSLGDLRIPSRVVSAQKGIREGVGMIKQFAAGVKDLQALMQQRALLEIALTGEILQDVTNTCDSPAHDSIMHTSPAGSNNGFSRVADEVEALDGKYADWWDMAEMLVTLADAGATDTPVEMDSEDMKKGRRVTVAATPSTARSQGFDGFPLVEGPSQKWRATTGRQTLSQRQLAVLQGMLSAPGSPAETAQLRHSVEPRARSALKEVKLGSLGPAPMLPPVSTTPRSRPFQAGRRTSRSGLSSFKDMMRGGPPSESMSLVSPASPITSNQIKSSRRPSLANLFRRSSSTFHSPTVKEQASPIYVRRSDKSSGHVAVNSISAGRDRLDSPIGISYNPPTPSPERCTLPRSPTQARNITGRDVRLDGVTVRTGPPYLQIPVPVSTEFAVNTAPGIGGAATPSFILTPENLPGLVKYLKEVTIQCKENVDGLEGLKARVRR